MPRAFLSWSLNYRDWKRLVRKSCIMFENATLFSRLIWFSDLLILNLKCVRSLSANSTRTLTVSYERWCCWVNVEWQKLRDEREESCQREMNFHCAWLLIPLPVYPCLTLHYFGIIITTAERRQEEILILLRLILGIQKMIVHIYI